jgi:hypothetical protein
MGVSVDPHPVVRGGRVVQEGPAARSDPYPAPVGTHGWVLAGLCQDVQKGRPVLARPTAARHPGNGGWSPAR